MYGRLLQGVRSSSGLLRTAAAAATAVAFSGLTIQQQMLSPTVTAPKAPADSGKTRGISMTPARLASLKAKLEAIVGSEHVISDSESLSVYGRDQYSYHSGPSPDIAVQPTTTEQVSAIMRLCSAEGIPVVARGGGTSLEGHATTPFRGLVLDFARMDSVLAVREKDMDVTVQAGVPWQELNKILAPKKLMLGLDPGPGAFLGGMCATNCSGTLASRYGAMKANVLSLTVVLADGTVVKTANRARKTSAGYDLTSLFVGSEGTLGVVTEATLKVVNLPANTAVAVCAFPSIRAASDAVNAIVNAGVQLQAAELLDAGIIHCVNKQSGFSYPEQPHVFFKFAGSKVKIGDDAAQAEALAKQCGGASFSWTLEEKEKERLWEARKVALWSAAAMDPSKKIATTDVCVPLSRMPDLMAAMEEEVAKSPLTVTAVAHVADGNAHHFIAFDPSKPEEAAEAKRLNSFLVKTAIAMEGTSTGEHGVGMGKVAYLPAELGESTVQLMRTIKDALDPRNILNPGKKVPAAPPAAPPAAKASTVGGDCGCKSRGTPCTCGSNCKCGGGCTCGPACACGSDCSCSSVAAPPAAKASTVGGDCGCKSRGTPCTCGSNCSCSSSSCAVPPPKPQQPKTVGELLAAAEGSHEEFIASAGKGGCCGSH